jgi:hypothetical protein
MGTAENADGINLAIRVQAAFAMINDQRVRFHWKVQNDRRKRSWNANASGVGASK